MNIVKSLKTLRQMASNNAKTAKTGRMFWITQMSKGKT